MRAEQNGVRATRRRPGPRAASVRLPRETEAGPAGKQPGRGIARRTCRNEALGCGYVRGCRSGFVPTDFHALENPRPQGGTAAARRLPVRAGLGHQRSTSRNKNSTLFPRFPTRQNKRNPHG